jgi:hypothetical protein
MLITILKECRDARMIHFKRRMYVGYHSGVTVGILDHVVQGCTQGGGDCQAAAPPSQTEIKRTFCRHDIMKL